MSDRRHSAARRRYARLLWTLAVLPLAACALLPHPPPLAEPVNLIAVLPLEATHITSATPVEEVPPEVPDNAPKVITAQIYGVMSSSSEWRFVPDIDVERALAKIPAGESQAVRARALGKAVHADAVIFGTVSRYVERVGSQYGAREPASVSFTLHLVSAASGKILWTGRFAQTQKALSSNLFNLWQFWRGGPKWFTAEEFSRLGVERLLNQLADRIPSSS